MAITRSEFENARKVVQTAIFKYGDIRTALLTINKLEADAIRKCMKVIADYFVQTRKEKQAQQQAQSKENTK